MRLLSIQSQVAFGHVGNSAAVFPLQRLGIEVLPVSTVLFSNHTGYGSWRGPRLSPGDVSQILLGVEERGGFRSLDVVLSGYLGDPGVTEVVADAVRRVKLARPGAVYACDPVIGNATVGRFVTPELTDLVRSALVPLADVMTPNQFELGLLTDTTPSDFDSTLDAVERLRAAGPTTVVVTSVTRPESDPEVIEMLAVDASGAWLCATPRLPGKFGGTGDVAAALFTAHLVSTADLQRSLERTTSSVFDLIDMTVAAGEQELLLVAAQDRYVEPRMQFPAVRVRHPESDDEPPTRQ